MVKGLLMACQAAKTNCLLSFLISVAVSGSFNNTVVLLIVRFLKIESNT